MTVQHSSARTAVALRRVLGRKPLIRRHRPVALLTIVMVSATMSIGSTVHNSATAAAAGVDSPSAPLVAGTPVLGQPNLASKTLASRCAATNAQFSYQNAGGFTMNGPAGIAIGTNRRLYVTDYGGQRVLSWPNADALTACQAADFVIGAGALSGPEAVTVDGNGVVYVADTLNQVVKMYRKGGAGFVLYRTLGTPGISGSGSNQFHYPRGVAVGPNGRLFVADDNNNRIMMFDPPFFNQQSATDSISNGADGGFAGPKAVATVGNDLFVADYYDSRVLRFTGPFNTPSQVYVPTATFSGVVSPVDLGIGPDGSLYVSDQGDATHAPRIAVFHHSSTLGNRAAPDVTITQNVGPVPLGIEVDRSGRMFMADYQQFRVIVGAAPAAAPVDLNATPATRSLLADLTSRPGRPHQVAIGQEIISWQFDPSRTAEDSWYDDWNDLTEQHLALPKYMEAELSDLMPGTANTPVVNELIAHAQAGGISSVGWHPDNPVPGGSYSVPDTTAQLRQLLDARTATGQAWRAQLDRAASALTPFSSAGAPMLLRPFMEMNGGWFWWADDASAGQARADRKAAFSSIWRDMVHYLTVTKGLHNLLFTFAPNAVEDPSWAPVTDYFPGGDAVDVVGIDVYDNNLYLGGGSRGLDQYAALVGTGKPFGLTELGQSFSNTGTGPNATSWDARTVATRIRDSFPEAAFANAWYSDVENGNPFVFAYADVANTAALFGDPIMETMAN